MAGVFYGVGVGPGDPDLLTVKAIKTIEAADVIIAPKTEKKEGSVALSIASPYLRPDVEIVAQVFPMVSDGQILTQAWKSIQAVIVDLLAAGKNVVFLTLGDPMFYSTYIYMFRLLENCGYQIETVPGVPAFCAISSQLGYPLVEGDDILSIIPATADSSRLDQVLAVSGNVVLMKVYKNYEQIVEQLDRHQLLDKAVMVSRCGLPEEQVVRCLHTHDQHEKINYLSTILTRRT